MRSLRWPRGTAKAGFVAGALLTLLGVPSAAPAQSPGRRIDALVRAYAEQSRFNGAVLVAHRGRVIYRKAFGWANAEWQIHNTPTTRFRVGSITKQFTATLILMLAEEGKLRLDGTIRAYLPEYPAAQGDRVTVHQLLTHASGIPSYTGLPGFMSNVSRNPARPAEFVHLFDTLPFEFPPGSQFRYNNSGYYLLGAIIERLEGESYDQVLRRRILEPLGLRETGYDWSADIIPQRASAYQMTLGGLRHAAYLDMSLPYAAGSMYSTVDDLWRWNQALTARRLLSAESYRLMETPHVRAGQGWYGYGWFSERVDRGPERDSAAAFWHSGGINGFAAMHYRIPGDDIAIIWLDNSSQGSQLHEQIRQILYGLPYDTPRPSIARALLPIIGAEGASAGIRQYREARARTPEAYNFDEPELNTLGYALLRGGRIADAVAIFALNVEMYPAGANTYDSLGEAYLAAGDTTLARANYRRSLDLNPLNGNAAAILQRIAPR
jgi:CubicO group peptidase (beta-lactamase class C family)